MVSTKTVLLTAACALTASATPIRRATAVTVDMLLQLDPSTATCVGDQCATAAQAAPALNDAFAKYKITDANTQAALVAYMYFESAHWVYNTNQQGNEGQGTRMMAKPGIVAKYAAAAADPAALQAAGSNKTAILETVNKDNDLSFGAGPWFLSTQCSADIQAGLAKGTLDGWHNFLTTCVSTTVTTARDTPYTAALKIFAGAPSAPAPAAGTSAAPAATSAPSQAQPSAPSKPAPAMSSAAPSQAAPAKQSAAPAKPSAAPAKPSAAPAQQSQQSSPQAQPSQPSVPTMPAPATPSATGTTPPSSPSGNGNNACSNNGGVVCNGEKQFGLCNNGFVVWQDVAAGTSCANGVISKRSFTGRIASPRS